MAKMEYSCKPGDPEFNILQYLSDYTDSAYEHCMNKYPEREWMFKIQKFAWNAPYHESLKEDGRLVFMGSAVPPELIYAFNAVPLIADSVGIRLASDPHVINYYLDKGAEIVPSHICGIDRTVLGMVFSGDLKIKPAAYVYGTIPCDSARAAYPVVADKFRSMGVPTLSVDVPYRKDEKGTAYIAKQLTNMIEFMEEEVFHEKIDRYRLAAVMYRSNEATRLLEEVANLRKLKPSYAMSRLLVLNSLYMSVLGSQPIIEFLRAEYDYIIDNIEHNRTVVPGGEKYRYTWLQNMPWSTMSLVDWLEREYGAVQTMDALGFNWNIICEDPLDYDCVIDTLARRQLAVPMMHANSGPAQPYIDLGKGIIKEYDCDVSMFIGHVGCKHTWAAKKMLEDSIQAEMGIPTLTVDLDSLDGRYKDAAEVQAQIKEYMDSLA